MEANTLSHPTSCKVLTILIFIILLSLPNTKSASACSTTINASNSSKLSNYTSTPSNSSSTQSNHTNSHNNSSSYSQIYKTYIISNCNSSTYPSICYQALYPYASEIAANPLKLSNTSLSLALKAARKAPSVVSDILKSSSLPGSPVAAIKDCLSNVKDSVEELQQSLDAMEHLEGTDKKFQLSSIQTWVSAAITDDETCSDGLNEENVDSTKREKIRKIILTVARMTSNALHFINNLS